MSQSNNQVWYVTGVSAGIGLNLVIVLLQKGYKVVGTTRSVEKTVARVNEVVDKSITEKNLLVLQVDLVNEESIENSLKKAVEKFGKIDVVVNNAGFGLVGAIEEVSDKEAREQFDVNFFGLLNVCRKSLPLLRESAKSKPEGSGSRIYNISSVAGIIPFGAFGIYCASKFAVEGLSGSLANEAKAFNVQVTAVNLGYFRTEFLHSTSYVQAKEKNPLYAQVHKTIEVHAEAINNNQPGSPIKAAEVLIKLANESNPPVNLALGTDSYQYIEKHQNTVKAEFEKYREIGQSTDYDKK
ncbi:short-chain dehydrogenase/reductase (SDR) family protein [Tieghemostelium lacteum]|uniref:Short-chain dehydrogenase/reductase (SDR) family protein n=1 Tax=Tieghemostelium lacteum TaxID=361077 RepID=A0A151ZE62_TIELA|nr:short-chain dehydrogenase/reductase (SDR) family protein [Tieghemostelium lacteum]|eukprot:KYQ92200.1 short-chain dehydrogenase/reductase (SDR) family protein [Tieghemostelium lacteum]